MTELELENKVQEYYKSQGYKVYTVELWKQDDILGTWWVNIEIGGSPEKYKHIHGYKPQEFIDNLISRVMKSSM